MFKLPCRDCWPIAATGGCRWIFVSWHCYPGTAPSRSAQETPSLLGNVLDEYGFKKAESHITGWHPMWYLVGDKL